MSGRRSNGRAVGEEGMTFPNVIDFAFKDHTLNSARTKKNVRNH
jgi:hypothetical protein